MLMIAISSRVIQHATTPRIMKPAGSAFAQRREVRLASLVIHDFEHMLVASGIGQPPVSTQ
jgi:hypothetical protein